MAATEEPRRAMVSQPLAGKTDDEITATRETAVKAIEQEGYEVVNTLWKSEWYSPENLAKRGVVNVPLSYLAKSIEQMCTCKAVFFARGWQFARGCRIENATAEAYGLKIYEQGEDGKYYRMDTECGNCAG